MPRPWDDPLPAVPPDADAGVPSREAVDAGADGRTVIKVDVHCMPTEEAQRSPGGSSQPLSQLSSTQRHQADAFRQLEKRLVSERVTFGETLKHLVDHQLALHHKLLLSAMEDHKEGLLLGGRGTVDSQVSAFRESLGKSRASLSQKTQPEVEQEPIETPCLSTSQSRGQSSSMSACVVQCTSTERFYKSRMLAKLSSKAHLTEEEEVSHCENLVTSTCFEVISCVAIVLNVCVMAMEVQYTGCRVSHAIEHADCQGALGRDFVQPAVEQGFACLAVLFSSFFACEFICRLGSMKLNAIYSWWMWFDGGVLLLGMVDTAGRLGAGLDLGVNPTAMRAARITRMLRMLKFFRGRESFHCLFLLLKSLLASRHAFVWSVLILYFTMTCSGLLINQLLYEYMADEKEDAADRREVYEYFGTYTRMIITMFEITLGNWGPPARVLMTKVSQWWGLFIVTYRCIFCFALVNVTAAVFITETSRVAADDEVQMLRRSNAKKRMAMTLTEIFVEMDTSCDGYLTFQELMNAMQDHVVKNLLEVLDLQVNDIQELYTLMDDGTGFVPQRDFIWHVLDLRGPARSIKQASMMHKIQEISNQVAALNSALPLSKSVAAYVDEYLAARPPQ